MVAFVPLDSRHPRRPAFGVDAWGAENDGGRGAALSALFRAAAVIFFHRSTPVDV